MKCPLEPSMLLRTIAFLVSVLLTGHLPADDPVALWIESFSVPPSTQPLSYVTVTNLTDAPYNGKVTMTPPAQWRIAPAERQVTLAAGETRRVPFTIEKGIDVESNSYLLNVSAAGGGTTVVRSQNVVCASAPYHKATIDGIADEWNDAIPASFLTNGRRTILRTYWNRRQFALLVSVEEDRLIGYLPDPGPIGNDAVQIALSPQGTATGTSPDQEATRYEFLLVWTGRGAAGNCFRLAQPGTKLSTTQQIRDLERLEYGDAKVAVKREGNVTHYECSLDFGPLRDKIRPSEGREFFLSVLVHDPDGTGVRDWGEAAGLWLSRRNRLAWSQWPGAQWRNRIPFDNKLPWGLCSSKY